MGASKSRGSFHAPGPVPGTVEIESEHEIATSAAVPGTAMRCPNARVNLRLATAGPDGNIGDERPQSGAIPAADHCHYPGSLSVIAAPCRCTWTLPLPPESGYGDGGGESQPHVFPDEPNV